MSKPSQKSWLPPFRTGSNGGLRGRSSGIPWRWWLLFALLILVPRIWKVGVTVAPARDSFRFFQAIEQLNQAPFSEAIKKLEIHPLYPLFLRQSIQSWEALTGQKGPYVALAVAQWSGVLAALLFYSLAFWVTARLFEPGVAFYGCVALAWTPRQVNYSADVLSDNLHAGLWMASFAGMVWLWQHSQHRGWALAVAAGGAGLAYLTRPEALLLPATFYSALLLTCCMPKSERSNTSPCFTWRSALGYGAGFAFIYSILLLPYCYLIGDISPRNSVKAFTGGITVAEPQVTTSIPVTELAGDPVEVHEPTHPPRPAVPPTENSNIEPHPAEIEKINLTPHPFVAGAEYVRSTIFPATVRLILEIGQEVRVWPLLFLPFALFLSCRSVCPQVFANWPLQQTRIEQQSEPEFTFNSVHFLPLFAVLGGCAMLILLQMKAGYLAGRYLTPVLPLLTVWLLTGVWQAHGWFMSWPKLPWEPADASRRRCWRARTHVLVLFGLVFFLCVPGVLEPLHRFRAGHMRAAEWLRQHTHPSEAIFDPTRFTSFFASRSQWLPTAADQDPGRPLPVRFAVIDAAMIYRTDNLTHALIARFNREGICRIKFPRAEGDDKVGVYIFELK